MREIERVADEPVLNREAVAELWRREGGVADFTAKLRLKLPNRALELALMQRIRGDDNIRRARRIAHEGA